MVGESWKIYWNEYAKDTYIYGSEVSFHAKDDVEFKNMLMPPGTVIKRWFSKTNFQAMGIEPSLPMIDGEGYFQCPLKSYSYEVQLINAGITDFHFHNFTIKEIIDDE